MKQRLFTSLLVPACLWFVVSFWGCAGRSYLIVDYKVPPASSSLSEQPFYLRVEDQRENHKILTDDAARQFKAFKERFSLSWIMDDGERILAGEHDVLALFKTAFHKRMAAMGTVASTEGSSQTPVLIISLEKFTLDLKNHKWIASVGYRATLSKQGHAVAKERVRGNAERVKVIGRKGADLVIGEIFSDVVNRLDIIELFEKDKLNTQQMPQPLN
jgi:hypothetical protein